MVINRGDIKRKRKDDDSERIILEESRKRTKVHAQRKFAQGSNVNSPVITPVITPVKELEKLDKPKPDVLPEPIELLPIKRPNTEDFLTFLCFRGTPILPPSLNFFNTASVYESGARPPEPKEETGNGPIPTSTIVRATSGSSSERPFIAFGVRKRADPIVISKQMERKRRHALTLQALRRKYEEQKMAKIRAVTISKLSERIQNKSSVRATRSISNKSEEAKESIPQKTKVKVISTKVATKPAKVALKSKIKQKMCLRSFRGRFVQCELQYKAVKKRTLPSTKVLVKKPAINPIKKKQQGLSDEFSSDDDQPLVETVNKTDIKRIKIAKKSATVVPKKPAEVNFRITRSNRRLGILPSRMQQIKQKKLFLVKMTPRITRSSQKLKNLKKIKAKTALSNNKNSVKPEDKNHTIKTEKIDPKRTEREIVKQGIDKNLQVKLERRDLKQDRKLIMEEPKNLSKKGDKKEIKIELKDVKEKIESKVIESEKKEKKDVKIEKKEVKQEVKMEKKDVKQEVKMEKQENKKEEKVKQKEVKLEAKSEDKPLKKKPDKEPDSKKDNKQEEVKVSQRPTRKTKEAAAIYMEILGHKLVHDGDNDDDSESFDSFPELPNVRKTEQRENELKAKAKFKMSSSKSETDKNKLKNKNTGDLNKAKCKELVNKPDVNKQKCKEPVNKLDAKVKCKEIGKVEVNKSKSKESVEKNDAKIKCKESIDKQKGDQNDQKLSKEAKNIKLAVAKPVVNIEKKVFDHLLKDLVKTDDKEKNKKEEKATKTKALKKTEEEEIPKRQTRQSQNKNVSESDSDESFYADVKIPRLQRKSVRNKRPKSYRSFSDSESSVDSPKIEKTSKSVINASDDNEKVLTSSKVKTNLDKKETKVESFSDSDEEPLSKLTKKDEDLKNNVKKDEFVENEPEKKPKRECTKRPQNYLTSLFSSSDDEDGKYFLGFVEKDAKDVKNAKLLENNLFSSADLLCKDVGRRFGKGKVNMSNEQIEKWLKDSALAGTSIKKENDAMLKFGEKIPSDDLNTTSSSEKEILKMPPEVLKTSETHESKKVVETRNILDASFEKPKTQVSDRKLIFRKVKKESTPNINAFSASNESSVYAFGEENEDVISTPFRRPSRRPSSTATSKSEDEVSKIDKTLSTDKALDEASTSKVSSEGTENILSKKQGDQTVSGCNQKKTFASTPMCPPSLKLLKPVRVFEASDDIKYKIPSSPSASSSSSAKISKRATCKPRIRPLEFCLPVNAPDFPSVNEQAQVVEAPVFYPTDKEFQDPVEYIDKIRKTAEKYGICRIVPPSTFKPECKVTDDMRFTAYNQYVHKMLRRWGPNFKELMAIKKYLETQSISLTHPPWIGGMEIDLPRLYQTVQNFGGLKEVIEKKKWPKVSEAMKIPKSAQDRVTKLDDIYCKYLLPYDTLSPAEREKLFDEVETDWAKRESRNLLKAQQRVVQDEVASEIESESDDEADECIVKGRSMALNAFYRIARNTMSMWFKSTEPTAQQVEQEFWKHVMLQQNHICVHSGSIDSGNWGYGFAVSKNSPFARHAWNLKVMTNNSGSVLRSMGPIMGVTVPTLHVGMVFSACCWYRDPHRLPWIEYLHTGGNKIWYGIPDSASEVFRLAVMKLVPNYCRNKTLWLPSDTAMVPPSLLVENGVSLCRTVQEPGQFVVIFPKAFTSSISTGYVVSESVYFAPPYWLNTAQKVFDELRNSCEPSMFSLDRLIISISNDSRSNVEVLKQILPALEQLHAKEKKNRDKLKDLGVVTTEKLPLPDAKKRKKLQGEDYECEICRTNLFVSMAMECQEEGVYCIEHAIEKIEHKKIQSKYVKLMFTYSEEELQSLVVKVRISIENKSVKKIPGKYAGMPTLLK